ncbi:hypothetical protein KGA66_24530 [Actinocrinis puniceicyclus]|uniref:Uncharacterized protein n=1 Tax=Actinocrinis puniceicyclus TaxID=977794 RepID=A0A8J8BGX8_9ACTN|nr:hypothetical protein [Actinocrinis puniceicyclus]MBS2966234.1 hypothetical protein [Actinocrinis puniceicyclus]
MDPGSTTDFARLAGAHLAAERQLIAEVETAIGSDRAARGAVEAHYLDPLRAELDADSPVVSAMTSAARAGGTAAFNKAVREFQANADRYEPAMNEYLQQSGLTECVLG